MRAEEVEDLGTDASANRKLKVLYIAGWGRSGSTILGRILGQVEGFFLVGELRYLWDRGLIKNRLCGCGASFRECPVWQEVTTQAFGEIGQVEAERLTSLREHGLRTRHLLSTLTHKDPRARVAQMEEYPEALEKLYGAVQSASQSRVIVDTSKFPSYGYVLETIPSIELYVLHLVRDPRAVAYSWAVRKKLKPDSEGRSGRFMTPHGFIESSLVWSEWNFAIERAWGRKSERYMLLRYEDFVESPRSVVGSILKFLDEEESQSPFVSGREVPLGATHTFSGNPDRFQNGTVKIESDEEWRYKISGSRQALVAALTWPGLIRYRYPLWLQSNKE